MRDVVLVLSSLALLFSPAAVAVILAIMAPSAYLSIGSAVYAVFWIIFVSYIMITEGKG